MNLVCAPVILLVMMGQLVFSNSDEWYRSPDTLSKRTLTPYARWLIREYKELPHLFEARFVNGVLCMR